MKVSCILAAAALAAAFAVPFSGCSADVDYVESVSEMRSEIYTYSDDGLEFKLYCVEREQPFNADGICGEKCALWELYAKYPDTPSSLSVKVGGYSGEMNYEAVKGAYTLTFSAGAAGADGLDVELVADGKAKSFKALNVADSGVISCRQAVECAAEYDKELFESLKTRAGFAAEIYVRLLYDEGCYYYVGVCDRNKNLTAYLLDGGLGKVITTKKLTV